jgi:hypothetical protein
MSGRSLSRDSIRALAPLLVPLVTKVALPIVIESLRRGKFDPDEYLQDAKSGLGKGFKKSRADLEDVREEVVERGQKLYSEARKQGAELLEVLAQKGSALAEDLLEGVRPPRRRRRFPWKLLLGVTAVAGIGLFLASRD